MIALFITIPFMILGIAIAVVPLLWAMRHQHAHEDQVVAAPAVRLQRREQLAA